MTKHRIDSMLTDQRGATAIEYGLLAAGVSVAIAAALFLLGVNVAALFGKTGALISATSETDVPEMTVIASHSFATGREEWTGGELRTLPQIGTGLSIAGPQVGVLESLRRTFKIPEGATRAEVTFDMSFVDSWDNEEARIYVNGQQIGTGIFQWNSPDAPSLTFAPTSGMTASARLTSSVRAGTWGNTADGTDHSYAVTLTMDNPGSALTLGFGTSLNQSQTDESLLIGNVAVSAGR